MTSQYQSEIIALEAKRSKSLFVKTSLLLASLYLILTCTAQLLLGDRVAGLFPTFSTEPVPSIDFIARLQNFAWEIIPYPVRQSGQLTSTAEWAWSLLQGHAFEAAVVTLCIALVSVLLAAFIGYMAALLGAIMNLHVSKITHIEKPSSGVWLKRLLSFLSNSLQVVLIFMRAIPDLIWAYIILSILGPTYLTAIVALTIHNAGVLGRIGRDIIQNAHYPSLKPLQDNQVSNRSLVVFSILPEVIPRFLIYVFYRWETCMRDAVIVGMVGLPTLGYWIFQDAWPKFRYDEMMFYIVISAIMIWVVERLSQISRRFVSKQLTSELNG